MWCWRDGCSRTGQQSNFSMGHMRTHLEPPGYSGKEIPLPRRTPLTCFPAAFNMRGVSIFGQPHHTSTLDIYIHSLTIHPNNRDPSLYDAVRSLIALTRGYIRVLLRRQAWPERSLSTPPSLPSDLPQTLESLRNQSQNRYSGT